MIMAAENLYTSGIFKVVSFEESTVVLVLPSKWLNSRNTIVQTHEPNACQLG